MQPVKRLRVVGNIGIVEIQAVGAAIDETLGQGLVVVNHRQISRHDRPAPRGAGDGQHGLTARGVVGLSVDAEYQGTRDRERALRGDARQLNDRAVVVRGKQRHGIEYLIVQRRRRLQSTGRSLARWGF